MYYNISTKKNDMKYVLRIYKGDNFWFRGKIFKTHTRFNKTEINIKKRKLVLLD